MNYQEHRDAAASGIDPIDGTELLKQQLQFHRNLLSEDARQAVDAFIYQETQKPDEQQQIRAKILTILPYFIHDELLTQLSETDQAAFRRFLKTDPSQEAFMDWFKDKKIDQSKLDGVVTMVLDHIDQLFTNDAKPEDLL